jgi:rubrerythrin
MKPVYQKPGEELSRQVESKVKTEIESKVRTEVDRRVDEILKEREEKEKAEKAAKLVAAVDKAKSIKGEIEKVKEGIQVGGNNILCPDCEKGHIHRLDIDKTGLVFKCTGPECGEEYVLTPKDADYKCTNCSAPIKKPKNEEIVKAMSCPFCKSAKAVKFDWSKLWNVTKKATSGVGR